jgi:hypothetical protein
MGELPFEQIELRMIRMRHDVARQRSASCEEHAYVFAAGSIDAPLAERQHSQADLPENLPVAVA